MSVNYIDTVALDDNLRLDGVFSMSEVALSTRQTFGSPVVQRCARTGGDTITLVSEVSGDQIYGSYTGGQLEAIAELRDIGDPVLLKHHLGEFWVIIPPTALDSISQIFNIVDPDDNDLYTGPLSLITI